MRKRAWRSYVKCESEKLGLSEEQYYVHDKSNFKKLSYYKSTM